MDFRGARALIHSAGAVYSQGPAFSTQGEKTLKEDPKMKAKWHPKRLQNQRKLDPKRKLKNMMQTGWKMVPQWGPWESRVRPKGHPWAALGRLGSPWGRLRGPTGGQKWRQKAL